MKIISCPNCGASMEIQETRDFAYCTFCGTKIVVNEIIQINRNSEIENLLNRAYEYEAKKDYAKAKEYCDKVLDIDSKNESARALEARLADASPIQNVLIKYVSNINDKFKLRITLDGYNWHTIEPNGELSFHLSCGSYNVFFAGRKTYKRKITVVDERKIMVVTYTAKSRFLNEITIV